MTLQEKIQSHITEAMRNRNQLRLDALRMMKTAVKNKEIEKMVVLIKATDESKYKNVVDILDEMNITNMQRFVLVDITPVDKELIKESNL